MARKTKNTKTEASSDDTKSKEVSKEKSSVKELKKLRKKLDKKKEKLEKKLLRHLSGEDKKGKAERVNEKLEKVIKKEAKVSGKLKLKREDKMKQKTQKAFKIEIEQVNQTQKEKPAAKPSAKEVGDHSETTKVRETANEQTSQVQTSVIPKSKNQAAKKSIIQVRRMNAIEEIDTFIKGEKRVTVLQAATSRKNRLAKSAK